jgi:glycosyltransferase involved in cell wall biosynthesis
MAMRIAYLSADPGVPVFGRKGASVHVQAVVGALAARGARVDLLTPRLGGVRPPALADVAVHELPPVAGRTRPERERAALAANADATAALAAHGPFDLVLERYSLWSHAGMEHARRTGATGLLEVNAPLIEEQATHRSLHDRTAAEAVAVRAFAAADRILAVSDGVALHLAAHPAARGRIDVVPNGVDPARFAARPAAARAADGFTVGFVGTLKPWHGLDVLIEAFGRLARRVPRARLLLVGDGPERARIEAALAARGLSDRVRLTGAVAPEAVPSLLLEMDAAVAPYPDLRPFYFSPLKLFEYMAAEVPVVASRVGQVAEVLEHERTGLLVPAGDATALAVALERLARDRELGGRLGRAGREEVELRHTWDAVAQRILEIAKRGRASASAPRLRSAA